MSDATAIFSLPYPEGSDPGDPQAWLQALAERMEAIQAAGIRSAGKKVISAEQHVDTTAYASMGTPDRVDGIVVPEDGLIFVTYRALVKVTGGTGYAALWVGDDRVEIPVPGGPAFAGSQVVQYATVELQGAAAYGLLFSGPFGLAARPAANGTNSSYDSSPRILNGYPANPISGAGDTDVSHIGGIAVIEAEAGTYNVGVRFSAPASGSIYVKERKLRVWSQCFDGMPPEVEG